MNTLIFVTGIIGIVIYDLLSKIRKAIEKNNLHLIFDYLKTRLMDINNELEKIVKK